MSASFGWKPVGLFVPARQALVNGFHFDQSKWRQCDSQPSGEGPPR